MALVVQSIFCIGAAVPTIWCMKNVLDPEGSPNTYTSGEFEKEQRDLTLSMFVLCGVNLCSYMFIGRICGGLTEPHSSVKNEENDDVKKAKLNNMFRTICCCADAEGHIGKGLHLLVGLFLVAAFTGVYACLTTQDFGSSVVNPTRTCKAVTAAKPFKTACDGGSEDDCALALNELWMLSDNFPQPTKLFAGEGVTFKRMFPGSQPAKDTVQKIYKAASRDCNSDRQRTYFLVVATVAAMMAGTACILPKDRSVNINFESMGKSWRQNFDGNKAPFFGGKIVATITTVSVCACMMFCKDANGGPLWSASERCTLNANNKASWDLCLESAATWRGLNTEGANPGYKAQCSSDAVDSTLFYGLKDDFASVGTKEFGERGMDDQIVSRTYYGTLEACEHDKRFVMVMFVTVPLFVTFFSSVVMSHVLRRMQK